MVIIIIIVDKMTVLGVIILLQFVAVPEILNLVQKLSWMLIFTFQRIKEKIEEERRSGVHEDHSAFVFAVLSHGCEGGYIYGSDGNGTSGRIHVENEIISKFDRWNCVALRDTPKIFIIHSCRGPG